MPPRVAKCRNVAIDLRGLLYEGGEGIVSTACTCASIPQILKNPITYGYCLHTYTVNYSYSNLMSVLRINFWD